MSLFAYRYIGQALLTHLLDLLHSGESIVLLGPRNIGKEYVLRWLAQRLADGGYPNVGLVRFRAAVPTDEQFVLGTPASLGPGVTELGPRTEDVFAWVDQMLAEGRARPILLAAHPDYMPYHEDRDFLAHIRVRVEGKGPVPGRLVAVVAGEADLRQLVTGPNSEFNCANPFALCGFDMAEFRCLAETYAVALRFPGGADSLPLHSLYERTGGNVYFLRMLLWAAFERWTSGGTHAEAFGWDPEVSDRLIAARLPWTYQLRYVTRLIEHNPDCWDRLERLCHAERVPAERAYPELLELAGLAVRDPDGYLRPPGTIIAEFLREYYTPRRLADLRAVNGLWGDAFARYRDMAARGEDMVRPRTIDDVVDVENVVRALSTSFAREALRSPEGVRARFLDGCRLVLGFSEVTCWEKEGETWTALSDGFDRPGAARTLYQELLENPERDAEGFVQLKPSQQLCVVARLTVLEGNKPFGMVIVGNPSEQTIISRARQRCARHLLRHFADAHPYAAEVDRLRLREKYLQIVNRIFAALGTEITDVEHALCEAAEGLRRLGYCRVLFSLIDSTHSRIVGVVENSCDEAKTMQRETNYSLDDPDLALQTWVVDRREAVIVQDGIRDPRINRHVAETTQLKNAIIAPLLSPQGTPLGTILVERDDGRRHTESDRLDLAQFAVNLGSAITQAEGVELLRSALNKLPAPVAIFDARLGLRYANAHAAFFLGTSPGSRSTEDATRLGEFQFEPQDNVLETLEPLVKQALREGKPQVKHAPITTRGSSYHVAALVAPLSDWRKELVGVVCQTQDLSYLYRVFKALRSQLEGAHNTKAIVAGTIQATRLLGHLWGRLWEVDETNDGILVGTSSFDDSDPDAASCFVAGKHTLPPRGERGWESWAAIESGEPVIFCHYPEEPDGAPRSAFRGLLVRNVQHPSCSGPFAKKPGDWWIDFPLRAGESILGKLTLDCPQNYSPDEFEFLKVLCGMVSHLLAASLRWEREFKDRTRWMEQSAAKMVRDTCHHLGTQLAALPALIDRYQQVAGMHHAVPRLNERFRRIVSNMMAAVSQTNGTSLTIAIFLRFFRVWHAISCIEMR